MTSNGAAAIISRGMFSCLLKKTCVFSLFSKFRRKLTVIKKFVLSSGSCCFDRKPRSRRDCWALFFHSKMLPLDKTPCVCSRHGAAVNTPAVYLPHIFLWLDYCCGTNILASRFKISGSTEPVIAAGVCGMMIAALFSARVDYTWFIKFVFRYRAVAVIQAHTRLSKQ